MNVTDQTTFCIKVKEAVKKKGYRMDYFYKRIGISPTHWSFIKKGERALIKENRNKINKFLNTKF